MKYSNTALIIGGKRKVTTKVREYCLLVLLIKLGSRQGRTFVSEGG
jgi:hypothetical protein